LFVAAVLSVVSALTPCAQAVVVPLDNSGWSMIITDTGQGVSMPIVESSNAKEVVIQLGKTFTRPPEFGLFEPIIIEFEKTSADASSNIVIRDEYIINDTASFWFDFHMYLMVDAVRPQAGFNPCFVPDGDQLEDVFYSHNLGYNAMPVQLHFFDADGYGVPFEPPGDDVFWPGLVSGRIVIATDPGMQVGARFGLKEIPTIPEPASFVLLAVGSIITAGRKRRSAGAMTGQSRLKK